MHVASCLCCVHVNSTTKSSELRVGVTLKYVRAIVWGANRLGEWVMAVAAAKYSWTETSYKERFSRLILLLREFCLLSHRWREKKNLETFFLLKIKFFQELFAYWKLLCFCLIVDEEMTKREIYMKKKSRNKKSGKKGERKWNWAKIERTCWFLEFFVHNGWIFFALIIKVNQPLMSQGLCDLRGFIVQQQSLSRPAGWAMEQRWKQQVSSR